MYGTNNIKSGNFICMLAYFVFVTAKEGRLWEVGLCINYFMPSAYFEI